MIGYSDSNKDVGLRRLGLGRLPGAERDRRGAARARRALGVLPRPRRRGRPRRRPDQRRDPGACRRARSTGRLKMTEQGEVLAAKYAVRRDRPPRARADRQRDPAPAARRRATPTPARDASSRSCEEMAERLSAALPRRSSTTIPTSSRFFETVTPVEEISRLRLGSRPARRSAGGGIDDLRAIPWVFSWTQARIVLPAWFGLGTALAARARRHGLELLREMAREWPFFAALLSNAEMALREGRPGDRRGATPSCGTTPSRASGSGRALEPSEFERTRERARCDPRRASGCSTASRCCRPRSTAATRTSIRCPSCRSSCCAGCAATATGTPRQLGRVSLLTINGIASGLRNTG